ncbi:Diphthamide biosynthesis protein 2 [Tulasnella sp. 418]|nr:Diphthamide biosynthesis protein 2 [Tulasnella sp. 418]
MAAAFSSSGEDAITRTLEVAPDTLSNGSIEDVYEVRRTVKDIQEGDYKRIALQFPDELLHVSVPIYRLLRSELEPERQIYVLADTTYGSCCVDEVAAQHVDADVVVHYGHACLSPTSRLPVIYVFGQHPVDPEKAARALASVVTKETVLLLCDVSYAYQMGESLNL